MKWEGIIQKINEAREIVGYEPDPFENLGRNTGNPLLESVATVSSTFRRSAQYSEVVVSFTVTVRCPQTERFLDLAGELVYEKARELTNDGFCAVVADSVRLGE